MTPQLRFPEFEGEWVERKLGEIGSIINGLTYSPKDINSNGILVLRSSNIQNRTLTFNDNVFVKTDKYNPVKEKDILICVRNGSKRLIGKNAIIPKKYEGLAFGAFMAIYRSSYNNFLFQWFDTTKYKKEVFKNLGATINSINGSDLRKFSVPIPTPPEQTKIATFLTAVDKRINLLQKKKAELTQYKKGVMQKLFSQELRFKQDDGSDFPDWEEKKLGEVCKVQGGFAFKSSKFKETGIPIIRISNISNNDNFIDVSNMVYYDKIQNDQNYIIKNGDLLIAMSGATTGKTSVFNLKVFAYVNQRVGLFKSLTKDLFYPFITQFVLSNDFENQLNSLLVAGAQPNISSNDIESIKIPYPHKEEQQKIANFLSSIDKSIEKVEKQIEASQVWKKGLLQQMFV